jgi:hypothetical protein
MRTLWLAILLIGYGSIAAAGFQMCVEDGTVLTATGAVRVGAPGRLLHEYKCLQGHTFWIDDTPNISDSAVPPKPDAQQFPDTSNPNQQALYQAGQGLGELISAQTIKRPVDLVIGTKCGKYGFATVTYSDKSGATVTLSGEVNAADMAAAKAKFPLLRIVNIPCGE